MDCARVTYPPHFLRGHSAGCAGSRWFHDGCGRRRREPWEPGPWQPRSRPERPPLHRDHPEL